MARASESCDAPHHSRTRSHAQGRPRGPLGRCCLLAALALLCWPQRPSLFCGRVHTERRASKAAQGKLAMRAEASPEQAGKSSDPKSAVTGSTEVAAAAPEENPIVSLWAKVKAEIGEDMQKARDARLGFFLKD
eukprot:5764553-Amphidinium_carterae.1